MHEHLSRAVEREPLDAGRVAASWGAVRALQRRDARQRRLSVSLAIVTSALLAVVVVWRTTAPEPNTLSLADGSRLLLSSDAELVVEHAAPEAIALSVRHGRVTFDVVHRTQRSFVVRAAGVEVRVVGTSFDVRVDSEEVVVEVRRGEIDIVSGDDTPMRLRDGERWRGAPRPLVETSTATPPPPEAPAPEEPEVQSPEPPKPRPPRPTAPPLEPKAPEPLVETPPPPEDNSPPTLFRRAQKAERDKSFTEAARLFELLAREHPSDSRAAASAYEAGRLLHERLHDLPRAHDAYARALELGLGEPLREGTLARQVQVLEGMGRLADCRAARLRYLSAYPSGAHVPLVQRSCQ